MHPREKPRIEEAYRRKAAARLWSAFLAIVCLAAVTQTCGEDEPATPLGPVSKPAPLLLSEADSLVWESNLGEDLGLASDDTTKLVQIGFDFEFYGTIKTEVYVDTNGNLHFDDPESHFGSSFPFTDQPMMIAPFYADLDVFDHGAVYYNLLGDAPHRRLVVTWFEVPYWPGFGIDPGEWNTFQVQLFESTNQIQFGYNGLFGGADVGIARDEFEYIAAEWSRDSLDMSNICYYPEDDTYEESMGPCSPCPNQPYFRGDYLKELEDLWNASKPHGGTVGGIRVEREYGAWIAQAGDEYEIIRDQRSGQWCNGVAPGPKPSLPVGRFHTHSLPINAEVSCGIHNTREEDIRLRTRKDIGPSAPDTTFARNNAQPSLKFYVVELDFGVFEYYFEQGSYIQVPYPGCIAGD